MTFGDATSRSDVELGVNLGRFRAEMGEAGQVYDLTTARMSKDSLRAAISHEKLLRAISRSGPESLAAKSATLAYRREMEALEQTSNHTTGALAREERQLGRLARGSLSGAGALGRLRGAAVFASTSFLGGYGLTYALRTAVNAASTLQEESEKTGIVFGKNARDVQAWARTLALSFGLSEDAALKASGTFGNMLRPLHFGEQDAAAMSKRLVELAADMASFNNVKPDVVLQALSSGLAGQVRPLRQYGVFLSQTRIEQEAYNDDIATTGVKLTQQQKVQAAYNIILKDTKLQQGDVARNTGSLSVSQSKLTAELQDSEATIARGLLPELVHLSNEGAVYLEHLNKTGRLQHDVNHVMKDGKQIAHGFAQGFHDISVVAKPLIGILGGNEHAAKLLLETVAAYKLLKIATAVRAIGISWGFVAAEANVAAAAEARAGAAGAGAGGAAAAAGAGAAGAAGAGAAAAGGVAAGAGAAVAGGKFGPGSRVRKFGGSLAKGGANVAGAIVFSKLVGGFSGAIRAFELGQGGDLVKRLGGPLDVTVYATGEVSYKDPVTDEYVLAKGHKGEKVSDVIERDFKQRHPALAHRTTTGEDIAERNAGARNPQPASRPSRGRSASRPLGLTAQFAKADLALSKAEATGDSVGERRALEEERKILNLELASNKNVFKDKKAIYDQITGVKGQIDAIDQAAATKRQAAEKKLTDRRKAAAKKRHDERVKQRAAQVDLLTRVPLDLRIEEQTAIAHHASEEKLLAIYKRELHALELQIPIIRRLGLGKQAIYDARRNEAAIEKKITGLKKKSSSGSGDLLSASSELIRTYGSNLGLRGDPLSSQDGIALLDEIRRLLGEQVHHSKSTAHHTARIGKRARPGALAGDFAGQGL